MARRLPPDVDRVDVEELSPDELREARLAWWRAQADARDRADRTGDDAYLTRWLAEHPRPGPDRYTHLRRPGG